MGKQSCIIITPTVHQCVLVHVIGIVPMGKQSCILITPVWVTTFITHFHIAM